MPRARPRHIAQILAVLLVTPLLRAQTAETSYDEYSQTVWNTENGMPQNSVNAILQTRDGFLWLGTFGGLARFDGVNFTVFTTANTPGLKSNRILSLCESKNGTLWAGTDAGELMSYRNGVAFTYTARDGIPGGPVWAVKEDAEGSLWIGAAKGLARLRDGKIEAYGPAKGFNGTPILSIEADRQGSVWVAAESGLKKFENGQFKSSELPAALPVNLFAPLFPRRQGGYWIVTRNGLTLFTDGKFIEYPGVPHSPAFKIRNILEDKEGTLWISYFEPSQVGRLRNGKYSSYRVKTGSPIIRAMYEDREGNLWMGSDGGGLMRLKRRTVDSYTVQQGLPSDSIRAVTEDGRNGLWISTSAGLAHLQAGKFTKFTDRDGMLSYDTSGLCRDLNGNLWVGSNYGVTEYSHGRFFNYSPKEGLSDPLVNAIFADSDSAIWVGTNGGLNRLLAGKFKTWHKSDGLVDDSVRFILQSSDKSLWLGTVGGLSRFKDGKFTNYTTSDGLSNNYVRAIFEDADGSLWLGTYGGGLNRLKNGHFTAVTMRQGLFDDFISRILADDQGRFWFLGNRGVFTVDRKNLLDFAEKRRNSVASVSYGTADGMISSEGSGGSQPAGWRATDGKLWFPTIKGLVAIDPRAVAHPTAAAVIEQVKLDGEVLPQSQAVRIRPGRENLEIHYTGLSLSRAEQVQFKFQLAGWDGDWINAGTRRTAYYSHLTPGEYVFNVVADNGYGAWHPQTTRLRILVEPPFWRTGWFVACAALGFGVLVFLAANFRLAQLKRARAAQQKFTGQLISSQENERKRIAAELHDSLGQRLIVIKNFALLLQSRAAEGTLSRPQREQIQEIAEEASRAMSEVKEISYNLRPYQLDRLGLTRALQAMIDKAAAASGTLFSADICDIDGLLAKDMEINFYRIVQECVNNILKHSRASHASVTIRAIERKLLVTIHDDGKGFTRDSVLAGGSSSGLGLLGISERAQLLGGKASVESTPGVGTTIVVETDLRVANRG